MTRRALSYDDNLEAPMSTPPHDISINNLWRRPIIPERKFSQLAEVNAQQNTVSIFTPIISREQDGLLAKLQIQSLEAREEKSSSAQSTPSNTPHSSPKLQRRGWFGSTSSEISISSSNSSVDMGGGGVPGEPVAGGAVERWGVFGPRLPVQSSTPDLGSDGSAAARRIVLFVFKIIRHLMSFYLPEVILRDL
ncbi:hypothetical protein XENOCAPTIV_024291 [Xenoophorus captivus]|uniref:Putative monooxygenase p33MONOX n=1 Tax=Xenoophorus captivus TaxID=1517983 RepID=A0ABV0QWL5_9TELE